MTRIIRIVKTTVSDREIKMLNSQNTYFNRNPQILEYLIENFALEINKIFIDSDKKF